MRLRLADAHARLGQVQLEAANVLSSGRLGGALEERGEAPASCGCEPVCVPAESLRELMSSIMRWRRRADSDASSWEAPV